MLEVSEEASNVIVDRLSSATTDELLQELVRTGTRSTRNQLVERHAGLARHVARRYRERGIDDDDLQQIALLGLVGAVNRFDPAYGASFSSFACRTIEGGIKRYFRDSTWAVRLPRSVKEVHLQVRAVATELSQELGRSPSEQDIAARLEASSAAVEVALAAALAYAPASLDNHDSA